MLRRHLALSKVTEQGQKGKVESEAAVISALWHFDTLIISVVLMP